MKILSELIKIAPKYDNKYKKEMQFEFGKNPSLNENNRFANRTRVG